MTAEASASIRLFGFANPSPHDTANGMDRRRPDYL